MVSDDGVHDSPLAPPDNQTVNFDRELGQFGIVMLFPLDPDCFLIGRACRLSRIWLDRVVVRPLLYQTILHTPQA